MPKVSEAHMSARYDQILNAAVACFADNGFHETTMQAIGLRAGISAGAVYRYFSGKDAIIEASWRRDQEARQARYALARQQGSTRRILDYLLTVYAAQRTQPEDEPRMRLRVQLLGEALRNPGIRESQRLHLHAVVTDLREIIRRGQKQGEINPILDAEATARLLMAVVDGLYVQNAADPGLDVEAYIKATREVFFGQFWVDQESEVAHDNRGSQLHSEAEGPVPR